MEERTNDIESISGKGSDFFDVVGLGALNWDQILRVRKRLEHQEIEAEPLTGSPGGSAANTVTGLSRLGHRTAFLGVVGADAEGKAVLEGFRSAGVNVEEVRVRENQRTGLALCIVEEDGERTIYLVPGANDSLSEDDLDAQVLERARYVHLSSFVGENQFELERSLLPRIPNHVGLSFAPGSLDVRRGMSALDPFLSRSGIVFLNREELAKLTGTNSLTQGSRLLSERGAGMVVTTLGSDPECSASVFVREREIRIQRAPALESEPADTTGAGDAFAAGFLSGVLDGRDLGISGVLGYLTAISCIRQPGSRAGLPDRDALMALLRRYMEACKA
jgi:ribokinase